MKKRSPTFSQWLPVIWLGLCVLWIPFAPMAAMAFDNGPNWHAYLFVWSVWLYPVSALISFWMRRRLRVFIFLPVLNLIGIFLSSA